MKNKTLAIKNSMILTKNVKSFFLIYPTVKKNWPVKISICFSSKNISVNFKLYRCIIQWVLIKQIVLFSLKSILCIGSSCQNIFLKKKFTILSHKKKIALNFWKNFRNIQSDFRFCFFVRIRLKKNEIFFWEVWNKIKCIIPESMCFKPCFGEKMVDFNQNLENSKTIVSVYKKFLLKFSYFEFLSNSENDFIYKNLFNLNEHILTETNGYFFEFIISFFSKIFWKSRFYKFSIKFYENKKIKKYIKTVSWFSKKIEDFWCKKNLFMVGYLKEINRKSISTLGIFHSSTHGFGILALKNIRKMTILTEYKGQYLDINFENHIEFYYKLTGLDLFLFKLNLQITLDATIKGNYCRLINHSCLPNCFSRIINHGNKNHVLLISKQKIFLNEELSYDYCIDSEAFEPNPAYCFCREISCKGNLNY